MYSRRSALPVKAQIADNATSATRILRYAGIALSVACVVTTVLLFRFYLPLRQAAAPVLLVTTEAELSTAIQVESLVALFAHCFTRRDVPLCQSIFTQNGQISLHSLFVEVSAGNVSVHSSNYVAMMNALFGTYSSSFMTLSNVEVTQVNDTYAWARAIGYVQRTLDDIVLLGQSHVSYMYSFSIYFTAMWNSTQSEWQLEYAQALPNATKLELDNPALRFGAPDGPSLTKRTDGDADELLWNELVAQIANLASSSGGQEQNARYLCVTPLYVSLKATFDTQSENDTLYCNTPNATSSAIAADSIKTINTITPVAGTLDFTITGGPGIEISGGMHGITITNVASNATATEFIAGYGILIEHLSETQLQITSNVSFPAENLNPMLEALTVAGATVLGTDTSCPAAPLSPSCIPPTGIVLDSLTVGNLIVLNSSLTDGQLLIGYTGSAPVSANLVAGANVVITNMPGSIIISASVNDTTVGTVMSVGLDLPTTVFLISGSPVTSMGTLTGSLVAQIINTVFAGPVGGAAGIPAFRSLGFPDLPSMTSVQVWMGDGANNITAGAGLSITFGTGLTTFTVTLVMPVSIFSVTSDVDGPTTVTLVSQGANTFLAAPSGANGVPSFRTFAASDLTSLGLTDGQLVIGSTGNTPVLATLVAGANVVITNMPGQIIISASVNDTTVGTVMSVGLDLPASVFSISGSPVTSMGTLTGSFVAQAINTVFAGPLNGASAVPEFRSLGFSDLPLMTSVQVWMGDGANNITAGSGISITFGTGLTTFTVTLVMPVAVFSVASDVNGATTVTFTSQTARTFLAAPSASNGVPSFRILGLADLPGSMGNGQLYIGNEGTPVISSLSAGTHITVTPGPGTLTVATTAEANTASNVNTAGVGVFKQKTSENLEFNGINAASSMVSVVLNGATNEIRIDAVPANIDHNALLNYDANKHVDHTAVSITAGTGLSGGGTLAATRTLNLANTAVTPGTYTHASITVDQQGRITSAANADIPAYGRAGLLVAVNWNNGAYLAFDYVNLSTGVTWDSTNKYFVVAATGTYVVTASGAAADYVVRIIDTFITVDYHGASYPVSFVERLASLATVGLVNQGGSGTISGANTYNSRSALNCFLTIVRVA